MSELKKNKILTAARSVFLRYGFRRVTMNDIAEAAVVSRPALYLLFKSKEEIFIGVYLQWVDETLAEIERTMATATTSQKKMERAFEIWAVRPFEVMMNSPEAKELMECSLGFARDSLSQGYHKFELMIVPVLATLTKRHSAKPSIAPERIAHVLASAVRGFKQTATTPTELRRLIKELLALSLSFPVAHSL
jgi:TetR/AcrR family transcriptional regulator of autoinduction and epiphytic fitness